MWLKEIGVGIYAVYARTADDSVKLLGVFALESWSRKR